MDRKRENLQSWFAGIFDGEGSVGVYSYGHARDPYYKAVVGITMNDPVAVGLIHREYPDGKLYTGMNQTGGNRYWRVFFQGTKCYDFLKEIKPYSVLKHEQVALTLSFLVSQRRMHAGDRTRERHERYAAKVAEKIKHLKREHNAVNSVNALLGHELREYRAKREEVEADVAFLLEGVETRLSATRNKTISAAEQDIVQAP